jgi:hypothetical protein
MGPEIIGVLMTIIVPLGAFVMIVYLRKYENAERLAMIEKGMEPGLTRSRGGAFGTLRFALLGIGIGLGLLVGNFLARNTNLEEEVGYFSMIFVFGGLGLLASYIVQLKREEKEQQEERARERERIL